MSRRAKVRHMDAEFLRHSGMRDLQSAKHRHSSLQKPMGRFILLADAFLATAHERLSRHQACLSMSPFQRKLCCKSKDIASKDQRETPKGCQEVPGVYIHRGVPANGDAADEEIRILRRFDKSQMDMSAAQTCLTTFAQRLHVLFVQKTATSSGYTQHASRQH